MSRALRFERIETEAGLMALEGDWRALFAKAGAPSPFLDFDWVVMSFRRHLRGRHAVALIAVIRQDGALVMAAPLQEERYRWIFTRYHGLATVLPQTNEILHAPDGDVAAWLDCLRQRLARTLLHSTLVLDRIAAHFPVTQAVAAGVTTKVRGQVAIVDLARGFDDYFNAFSRDTRSQMRRFRRRLADRGEVVIRYANRDSFAADLRWLLDSKSAWTPPDDRRLKPWIVSADAEADLNWLAERWVDDGRLALCQIELDGRRIASGMALKTRSQVLFYATTYNSELAVISPGRMLALELIEWSARHGCATFDMMAGGWEWKRRLSNASYPLLRLKMPLR